jgi:hypothetical protein
MTTTTGEQQVGDNDDVLRWLDAFLDELLDEDDTGEEKAEALELAESREQLVGKLVEQGSTPEDAERWVTEFIAYTTDEVAFRADDDDEFLALLDAPFKVTRDDTFPDPDRILVWDKKQTPSVQALTFEEATARYKCGGAGSSWVPADLEEIKKVKGDCLEETQETYKKRDADPDYEGLCCTPALIISNNPLRAHRWSVIKAFMSPETK